MVRCQLGMAFLKKSIATLIDSQHFGHLSGVRAGLHGSTENYHIYRESIVPVHEGILTQYDQFPLFLRRCGLVRYFRGLAPEKEDPFFLAPAIELLITLSKTPHIHIQIIDFGVVSHLVLNGSEPAPVAGAVINALKAREDASGFVKLDQRPKFAIGETVRVLAGVFAENLGLFDGMADRDRVAILLDLLGRKVRVSIDPELVTAA